MPVAAANLEELGTLTAAERVRTDLAARERFGVDGRVPAAVVEPADARELAEIVRWARSHRVALLPVTSGAFLPIGNPPAAAEVAVSLARMNRVLNYDPGDLTVSVEAGIPLQQVQDLLQQKGQFLPAAPPYYERAAVGGLLATNTNGPLRYAYGSWRDFVLGMKFVTGEGKLVKTGGRVVKNVAGYDLSKLLIGSLGTLGVITEVNFKVFTLPARTAIFIAAFRELEAALEMRSRIVHSVLQPTGIELLDAAAAQFLGSPALDELSPVAPLSRAESRDATGAGAAASDWFLVVAAGGVEKVLERYRQELESRAREAGALSFSALTHEHHAALWAGVRELVAKAREANPAVTIVKCSLPLTQVGGFLTKARAAATRYELPCAASAHAGSGIAYIYLLPAAGMSDAARRMAQAATEMVHAGNNLGGRTTVPWCPTEVRRDVNPWGPVRDDFPLMQKLKAQFDPDRILNPGRFVGGL